MLYLVLFLFALGGVLFYAALAAVVCTFRRRDGSSIKRRVLPVAIALFGCTFCLRLAAALGAACLLPMDNALADLGGAAGFEILADSLVHTMQTFSMDEDYTLYLLAGKEMLTQLGLPAAAVLYGFVSAVVNVAAPIAGGAILLDILCDFFPVLRYQLNRSSTRFVFNELNEASIQLAESIHQRQRATGGSYGIVFANTALDREDERENQLFARAQAIGAFCFTANLPEFSLRTPLDRLFGWTKNIVFLLLAGDASENLDVALRLGRESVGGVSAAAMVFSDDPADGELLQSANGREDGILRVLVPDRQNTVLRLLADRPLFLPLMEGGYDSLELLVAGSGPLAEEFLCQWAWCGQMLAPGTDRPLPLRLVALAESEEARAALEQRLRRRMPGWFGPESRDLGSLTLLNAAPGSAAFGAALEQHALQVSTAVACLEDVTVCRSAAMEMKCFFDLRELGRHRPVELLCYTPRQGIADTLEHTRWTGCAVRPFGTLKERFSMEHVFLEDLLYYAARLNEAYSATADQRRQNMRDLLASSYNMNSSLASAIHFPYKLFSAGAVCGGEDLPALRPRDPDRHCLAAVLERFSVEDGQLMDRMAWLEHCRWMAWAWTQGFRRPSDGELELLVADRQKAGLPFDHKSPSLRLHPCLVPSAIGRGAASRPEFWREVDALWVQGAPALEVFAQAHGLDGLDRVSLQVDKAARQFYQLQRESPFQPDGKPKKGLHNDFRAYDYDLVRALPENLIALAAGSGQPGPGDTLQLMLGLPPA